MKFNPRPLALIALAFTSTAFAQGKTDFALNDGQVRFHVPPTWTAIMEKADGNPQAVAFQVPDPSTKGSDDTASVTVKTRHLKVSAEFAAVMQDELNHAQAQGGYENDAANTNASTHQYFVVRGKTRYQVRDSFIQSGDTSVQVRCQRPLIAATPPAWIAEFDNGCNSVAGSLRQ